MEKRSRDEAAQAQVTLKRIDTVQHSSPCLPSPDIPPDVHVNLENNEGRMDPELEEKLESSSAGTGLKTPGQKYPPNEGTWEQRRVTANGFLTAGVDSSQGGRIPSPPERSTGARTFADIFSTAAIQENRRRKTPSQQNKQFDPGRKGEKAPPWNAAVLYLLFLGRTERLLVCFLFVLCASCFVSALCVPVFPKLLICPGDTPQQAERHEGRHGSSR